ncbi:hypothetical protein HPO_17549 [Hyphomonas polymorpha PS728]|uniref:Lipoprotein n=1 Tax=Hyphomonas polymorpha PS728 TaxID=1280954 RepID=A0A062V9T7_9PROT|nr:META domain-containing protein [Hyphomonas polymorpha]KCZ96900.1 hypothetical protein HPO_17549 [Hyphomonas polymorpha PS728]
MKLSHLLMAAATPLMIAGCGGPSPEGQGDADASLAFGTDYDCNGLTVSLGILDEEAVLRVNGKEYRLTPVETASGAKYAAEGTPETSFWNKGEEGLLMLEGVEYPGCTQAGGYGDPAEVIDTGDLGIGRAQVWTARGNEPGWTVALDGTTLTYIYAYGEGQYDAPQPEAEAIEGGKRYATADGVLSVTVLDKVCADDMSGMPYPQTVTVQMEDARVQGCGGDVNDLLAGAWDVIEVNGAPVMPDVVITAIFEANTPENPENPGQFVPATGQVGGKAGCNSYGAEYTVSGEGLVMGDATYTEMACPPDVMAQEAAFLDALGKVSMISFDAGGEMELRDHEFRQLYLRRQ